MSLTGRKTSLLEDAAGQVLREFQALTESEPARERAQSYSRGEGAGEEGPGEDGRRRRSSTFTQMKSKGYLERVKERRAETALMEAGERKGAARHNSAPDSQQTQLSSHKTSSLCGNSPANPGQFYEVLFLGKIKASHKRAPPSFIDEAIIKFQRREAEKDKERESEEAAAAIPSSDPLSSPPAKQSPPRQWEASNPILKVLHSSPRERPVTVMGEPGCNKTMLLQVGRTDLRLISPDRRQVLLHKNFREISHCSSGKASSECFGFICRDHTTTTGYLGYIFKCSSPCVVEDIMMCLKASFTAAHEATRRDSVMKVQADHCEACPLVWFNHICTDLEGLPPPKAQSVLLKRMESLEPVEKENILAKMQGAETPNIAEQNQVLMLLLKVSCEVRQEAHKHSESEPSTTGEGTHTHITLGGLVVANTPVSTSLQTDNVLEAAKRAKRSLADSFNTMVGRKMSLDISDTMQLPVVKETPKAPRHPLSITNAERRLLSSCSPEKTSRSPVSRRKMEPLPSDKHQEFQSEVGGSPGVRQRARTVGAAGGETMKRELARKRMARMREQEGRTPIKEEVEETPMARVAIFEKTGGKSPSHKGPSRQRTASQRQHIFQQVVTPGKNANASTPREPKRPKDYKDLWRKAIKQQILLIRMERENRRILEDEEQCAERRQKLDYSSLTGPSSENTQEQWEALLTCSPPPSRDTLRSAVAVGIPRARRGDAWQLLAKLSQASPPSHAQFPQQSLPYSSLKSQLTCHQHAILIDLGRTFPTHPYFSGALGPGQLGLFNMLKAYSLLDPEVGYCQGLPFSAGLLLMHLEEEPAFRLLAHLMLGEGLREMFHPDMGGLQVAMYQLTRLLAETHPNLYRQLDRLDVDPSLYATPWFLTLFAAHFPLGFVARVFDLLFFEGAEAIIKVSICLLVECEMELLACESLEELMTVLKTSLPGLSAVKLEDVVVQAASLSVGRQLHTYRVEYTVLQEEEASKKSGVERAKEQTQALTREVADLKLRLGEGEERERVLKEEVRKGEEKVREREERVEEMLLLLREIKGEVCDEVRIKIDLALEKS